MHYSLPLLLIWIFLGMSQALAVPQSPPSIPRNPFRALSTPTPPPKRENLPPLEQYPLSALSLTAIVTNMEGEIFASVEIPSGVGFKVVRGTLLGDGGARVIEISRRGIVVEEVAQGATVQREIALRREEN